MSSPTTAVKGKPVVSPEAIAEFRINTATYAADQGNGADAQVNLVTRTGPNELRGSVFPFLRNSTLDARLWNDTDAVKDPFQPNQFGFRVGGPARQDRSFFFLSFEGLRQRRGVTFSNDVPRAAFRQSVAASPNAQENIQLMVLVTDRRAAEPRKARVRFTPHTSGIYLNLISA